MSKTITRADLTEAVYREIGFSHTECADLVDSVLEEIIIPSAHFRW
jgi:integration host factor subunit alpha